MEYIPGVRFFEYYQKLCSLGGDIGLAPLTNNRLELLQVVLEVSGVHLARMVTVASALEPYRCIAHRQDGLLAYDDEWFDMLYSLVLDGGMRQRLLANARKKVMAEHSWTSKKAKKHWLDIWQKVAG